MSTPAPQNKNYHRSILRFLIFPKKQLKYAFFYFLVVCISVLTINVASYYKFMSLLDVNTSISTQQFLAEYAYTLSFVTLATLVFMGILIFIITIIFLHRFVGPIRPILKHLEALRVGNYTHKTHLRFNDEINEVAQKLNELSDHFASQNTKKSD